MVINMAVKSENFEFLKSWSDIYVDECERQSAVMNDYHAHDYYEISLIMSGDVKVLVPGASSESDEPRVVISAPGVPHYITFREGSGYRRINIIFSEEFISSSREAEEVASVFKKSGSVIVLDSETCASLAGVARMIMRERDRFRQRLLLIYYLSRLMELDGRSTSEALPEYVATALNYVRESYAEKIVAEELARKVNVGRTTLMTGFKRYTGQTLGDHILKCRLIAAVELLCAGVTERECAERCGFGESSNLIRSFKKHFGITPGKYIAVMEKGRKAGFPSNNIV